jgi:hypothetical protein
LGNLNRIYQYFWPSFGQINILCPIYSPDFHLDHGIRSHPVVGHFFCPLCPHIICSPGFWPPQLRGNWWEQGIPDRPFPGTIWRICIAFLPSFVVFLKHRRPQRVWQLKIVRILDGFGITIIGNAIIEDEMVLCQR